MARVIVVLVVVAVAFTIYTLVDVLLTDRRRIRAMPKAAWAVLVVVLPVLGGILWLIVGKARRGPGRMSRTVAPDDDPAFLGTLGRDEVARRAEQDERLRRLEQELADRSVAVHRHYWRIFVEAGERIPQAVGMRIVFHRTEM